MVLGFPLTWRHTAVVTPKFASFIWLDIKAVAFNIGANCLAALFKGASTVKVMMNSDETQDVYMMNIPSKGAASIFAVDPSAPLAGGIMSFSDAVLVHRPRTEGWRIKASVYDMQQSEVPQAICWHSAGQAATVEAGYPTPDRIKHLPGTWLFGGVYNPQFGHFFSETMARVWALDHVDEDIQGVLFFPVYNTYPDTVEKSFDDLFSIVDERFNWKIVDDFYRVDKLIIPPQGSGIKTDMMSSPDYRAYLRRHIRDDLAPTGHEKIYISRSEFTEKRRSILGEALLEDLLRREGYLIFHPQNHSLVDQVRHYRSARHIIGPDGSPFHLVNYVCEGGTNIAIIKRRKSVEYKYMLEQTRWFQAGTGIPLDHCVSYWAPAGVRRAALMMSAEVDYAEMAQTLLRHGMIDNAEPWHALDKAALEDDLKRFGASMGCDMHQVRGDGQSLSDVPLLANGESPQVFWR
jgi:hypothetical protein